MVKCGPRSSASSHHDVAVVVAADVEKPESYAPILPPEIIIEIYYYNRTLMLRKLILHVMCLVCRSWYVALVGFLYNSHHVHPSNFRRFVDVICSPTNAKTPNNGLADLVHTLDFRGFRRSAAKTSMKRLLSRVRNTLERFYAPPLVLS